MKEKLVKTALTLAEQEGWAHITPRNIASAAGINLADFYDSFEDKTDILIEYGRSLDREIFKNFKNFHPETPIRERLFDIVMERFDLVQKNRAGVLSILNSMQLDPKQAVISLPHLGRSAAKMLDLAGVDTFGIKGALRVLGFIGLYLYVLKVWMNDESADLSKTMAALDKALSQCESLAEKYL